MLYYSHEALLLHDVGPQHPERPDRLRAVQQALGQSGLLARLESLEAEPITRTALADLHGDALLAHLDALAPASGLVHLDGDTLLNPYSLSAAALAAGAVSSAVEAVLAGPHRRAFCAVRPPGHHAEADTAMGFCFYNSIALGAERALQQVDRVAILDFDVHHGNGTVDIFKERPDALVCSSFQHPFYPSRHFAIDRPNIVNTPLPEGTAGAAFRRALERDWAPAVQAHKPDLILISAGFDAHQADPLGGLCLNESDFRWVTEFIADLADEHAGGRIVSALEGGYDLPALGRSVVVHVAALVEADA